MLRTRLDLLKPDVAQRVRDQQSKQRDYHDQHVSFRAFKKGQSVWARNMWDGPRWKRTVVVDRTGPVSYRVRLESGRRHVDHLREGSDAEVDGAAETARTLPPVSHESTDTDSGLPAVPPAEERRVSMELTALPLQASEESEETTEDTQLLPRRYPSRDRRKPDRLYGTLNS